MIVGLRQKRVRKKWFDTPDFPKACGASGFSHIFFGPPMVHGLAVQFFCDFFRYPFAVTPSSQVGPKVSYFVLFVCCPGVDG